MKRSKLFILHTYAFRHEPPKSPALRNGSQIKIAATISGCVTPVEKRESRRAAYRGVVRSDGAGGVVLTPDRDSTSAGVNSAADRGPPTALPLDAPPAL